MEKNQLAGLDLSAALEQVQVGRGQPLEQQRVHPLGGACRADATQVPQQPHDATLHGHLPERLPLCHRLQLEAHLGGSGMELVVHLFVLFAFNPFFRGFIFHNFIDILVFLLFAFLFDTRTSRNLKYKCADVSARAQAWGVSFSGVAKHTNLYEYNLYFHISFQIAPLELGETLKKKWGQSVNAATNLSATNLRKGLWKRGSCTDIISSCTV